MVCKILLGLLILIGPVAANFSIKDLPSVQSLDGRFGGSHFNKFDKAIVETAVLKVLVRNDLDTKDWTSDSEDLVQHVFRYARRQVADIKMGLTERKESISPLLTEWQSVRTLF